MSKSLSSLLINDLICESIGELGLSELLILILCKSFLFQNLFDQ